ncbi:MAG TPA: CpsB/CapC family capsule biosynthesis tyrosine phosphatase [Bryobacteraceae bacterium]|nr:CpsB/CapC family capsule biosynthesis tyrosine phosphatase [Bryobacteraceae bacterium]
MVDIHSHILAGLDDGPATLEESREMLRMAAGSGTTDIVATPHANLEFAYDPEVVDRKIAELRAECGDIVHVHRGCDFHLFYENVQRAIAEPSRYTINGKTYLLVEFSEIAILRSTSEMFARMREAGMTPVITHPERNTILMRDVQQLRDWVKSGCRVQVTAQSLFGRFGRRARASAEQLMRCGLVHFIASDAHDTSDRPPVLDRAFQHIAQRYSERRAEALLITNPTAVLNGEPVPEAVPEPDRLRKWWWQW